MEHIIELSLKRHLLVCMVAISISCHKLADYAQNNNHYFTNILVVVIVRVKWDTIILH